MHNNLDPVAIVYTVEALHHRIVERFPRAHLALVAENVVQLAREAHRRSESLSRPIVPLRVAVWGVVSVLVTIFLYGVATVAVSFSAMEFGEPIQSVEAALSSVVFLGAAGIFLFTLETRVKRRRALGALHELRGLAHVIDMHQLAKDPKTEEQLVLDTASSPKLDLTNYELSRYLDYCSELLAIVNKMGALYARDFDDPVVLSGVDGLQRLVDGLSQKLWQKMSLVDRIMARELAGPPGRRFR